LINGYCGAGSGEIAAELGIHGHAITCSSGSASGNDVMGYAAGLIRNDDVDVMIAGGAEAPILPPLWGAFCHAHVMTRNNNDPLRSMRPFDADRDGFLLGEGGAFVVLEELSHALGRGARIYAEFASHGRSCEAYHPVAPHPDGIGVIRAMEKALRQARMNIEEIDYVNVHGTATQTNDLVETNAIKKLFGPHAYRLAISSTKPVTGHLLAASGAVETVVTALSLNRQEIPLTVNLQTPEPGLDLDYVKDGSRPYPVRVAMNLSSGFGGKNACLILAHYP
jgi:3-oxoacyl-[acyl-carrier-protein] synthase II